MMHQGGFVAAGFEKVRDAFEANFEEHGDQGAACCVYVDGRAVVDLWGGFADLAGGRYWEADTPVIVFSATKGVTAACVHLLAERGVLNFDTPVAAYWPEFAAAGKGAIPLRWVLSHRAGLAAVDGDLTLAEVLAWEPVVRAIAAQTPNWEPGTAHGYHARSYGWILGEVVRRVTGRSLGRFLADEIAGPLGLDFWIGLPAKHRARNARVIPPEGGLPSIVDLLGAESLTARVMYGPSGLFAYDDMWNRAEVLAAEMPSSNGVGSARALARLYAAIIGEVDGRRILRADTVERACAVQSEGADRVLLLPTRFGLGFMLPPMLAPGCGPQSFGHTGAGGSLGFADPAKRIGFGYVTTKLQFDLGGDERTRGLVRAVYRSL
jgi:CubicO group peptidase (beta-lactamase class C family)